MGAIPLSIVLYRIGITIAESNATLKHTVIKQDRATNEHTNSSTEAASAPLPLLGGNWLIPKNSQITPRLLIGAALFGIGWALEGVCRECCRSCHFLRLNSCHRSGTCFSEPWLSVYYGKEPRRRLAENWDVAYRLCCRWRGHTLERVVHARPEHGVWRVVGTRPICRTWEGQTISKRSARNLVCRNKVAR